MSKSQQLLPNLGLSQAPQTKGKSSWALTLPALAAQAQPFLTWVSLVVLTQCLLNSFQLDLLSKLISVVFGISERV